jgi:hypothetical protein
MNFDEFIRACNTEKRAVRLWKSFRDKQGSLCGRCGGKEQLWLPTKLKYRCKQCKSETTVRSGSIMEYSKLPFRFWMYGIGVLAFHEKPAPDLQIQKKLRHPNYRPIWFMMKRLRELKADQAAWSVMLDQLTTIITESGVEPPKPKKRKPPGGKKNKQAPKKSQAGSL